MNLEKTLTELNDIQQWIIAAKAEKVELLGQNAALQARLDACVKERERLHDLFFKLKDIARRNEGLGADKIIKIVESAVGKFAMSKAWCQHSAELEGDSAVGAGLPEIAFNQLAPCPVCNREPSGLSDEQGHELHCCGLSSGLQNSDSNCCIAWNERVSHFKASVSAPEAKKQRNKP